ncbi:splicing regulatory glutamine/lysine-rich protein 1-like isoform X2 [Macrobrachium rosenbergii]|uniref:splicing regulatory glutamine/lysine-rich protein 1-like isoform X2 n=1 Tax=Macrobrachium rosenbergii TaxID=79674 RepID=UPI0034D4238E
MERSWIFLMIVMVVALAHLQVGEKAAAEDNGDVKGLASLDHAGKSFFQEKPLEKNHNAEDENVRHRWHQNAGEIRRRAIRQSERWTNEDKQKGRRIRKQQAVKEKRRRSGSDEYHRRRRDVHNNKQNMKGGKRRHRGDSDSGQGRRRKHRSNSLNRGRKEKFVRTSEKPRNSRRSVPIDSERRRTNRDPDNFYSREGQGKGVRRRKEKRRRPKIDGKGKKRGTKKDDDMKEKLNKKKASSRAKSAKSTGPKRKKVKKMKIILGKGGKKAIPKGSCKVSRIVSAADGNSAILFGYNMQKKGSCKMTFKAPKGSTLSLDCPQFDLNSKGCDQEGMQVYDKASKKNSEHCLTSGPKDWKSSGNVAAITFRREASKDKCGRNFVCQITVTGAKRHHFQHYLPTAKHGWRVLLGTSCNRR